MPAVDYIKHYTYDDYKLWEGDFSTKTNHKKAVIMPYEEYNLLVSRASNKESLQNGAFQNL